MPMLTLAEIQAEVREWSKKNFNDTPTKLPKMYGLGLHYVRLGALAPLMGITEEVGELFESRTDVGRYDAVADAMIYLCDFAAFVGVPLRQYQIEVIIRKNREDETSIQIDTFAPHAYDGSIIAVGKLNHIVLKHHQGIRGFEEPVVYRQELDHVCQVLMAELWWSAACFTDETGMEILNNTWTNIVSKRDWKADSKEGGGHSHADAD